MKNRARVHTPQGQQSELQTLIRFRHPSKLPKACWAAMRTQLPQEDPLYCTHLLEAARLITGFASGTLVPVNARFVLLMIRGLFTVIFSSHVVCYRLELRVVEHQTI
jgi:hypothetical protein